MHATGAGIYDVLDRQIAKPIGMQDYRPSDGVYYTGPDSIHRAYSIRMSARDLAASACSTCTTARGAESRSCRRRGWPTARSPIPTPDAPKFTEFTEFAGLVAKAGSLGKAH